MHRNYTLNDFEWVKLWMSECPSLFHVSNLNWPQPHWSRWSEAVLAECAVVYVYYNGNYNFVIFSFGLWVLILAYTRRHSNYTTFIIEYESANTELCVGRWINSIGFSETHDTSINTQKLHASWFCVGVCVRILFMYIRIVVVPPSLWAPVFTPPNCMRARSVG